LLVLGVLVQLVLRFRPEGLLPERLRKDPRDQDRPAEKQGAASSATGKGVN
jgi:hypothetical protein